MHLVGYGASASVYRADVNGTEVAVKKVKEVWDDDVTDKEIDIWKSLKHPAVVAYHIHFTEQKRTWIVSEYMDMGSVDDLVKSHYSNGMETDLIRAILYQVISAIKYVHANKCMHRDVKPDNILVNSQGEVKVADFGLSTRMYRDGKSYLDVAYSPAGTILYCAPEVAREDSYSSKADIWSFGISSIVLIDGKPPNCHLGKRDFFERLINGDPPRSERASNHTGELSRFICRALSKNPESRSNAYNLKRHRFLRPFNLGKYHPKKILMREPAITAATVVLSFLSQLPNLRASAADTNGYNTTDGISWLGSYQEPSIPESNSSNA